MQVESLLADFGRISATFGFRDITPVTMGALVSLGAVTQTGFNLPVTSIAKGARDHILSDSRAIAKIIA